MGIIFSGGGVGGAVGLGISSGDGRMHVLTAADFSSQYMPLLNSYLIDKVGIGWTLRIIAISTGLVAVSRRSGMFLHQFSSSFPTFDKLGTGLGSTLHPPTSSHNTSHLHLHINYQHTLHSSLEDLCYSRILGLFLEHIVTGVRLLVGI